MTPTKRALWLGVVIVCGTVAAVPRSLQSAGASNVTRGCVERFDSTADYFPDKAVIEDATNFSVTYRGSYKVVTVQGEAGEKPERHVLVQCGTPPPRLVGDLAGSDVVITPVMSLFAFSTTQLPLLTDLDRLDVLTGVAQADAIADADIQQR